MTGLFVVFEGGDGVGKSTQVTLLVDWFTAHGHRAQRTHQPGDTAIGRQLRQIVLDPRSGDIDPRAEALLLAADKAQHLREVVRPTLAGGVHVVCDRYIDSMIAYQGAGRELDAGEIAVLAEWATTGLVPDLTILLDIDPQKAVQQKADRDRVEDAGAAFHARVRDGFLACAAAAPQRYLVLPALTGVDDLAAEVQERVAQLMVTRGLTGADDG